MKLYDSFGPNPKKVRVYLAEKGIELDREFVNFATGENRQPAFLSKNPMGRLPLLELDDGSFLPESLAIIELLEELHPTPPMLGSSPQERARIRALERLAELGVQARIATIFLNTSSFVEKSAMAGRLKQSPEAAAYSRWYLAEALHTLDSQMGASSFVAGDVPTIADCTLFAALELAEGAKIALPDAIPNVMAWYERFKTRPSASA